MACYEVLKDKLSTALWHTVRLSQFHLLVKYFVGKKQVMSAIETLMDNGNVMMPFFKNIPNNWPIWADGPNELWGIWGNSN